MEQPSKAPTAATSAVSWRPEGIKYRKNEVFLDVVESVNLLASPTGSIVRSEVMGVIKIKCHLSGMPELRLGLNDKFTFDEDSSSSGGVMEDVKFHQCVRLQKFDQDRTISFIPPDGDFELLSYRVETADLRPPIWCECTIERWSSSRIELFVKVRSQLKRKTAANQVEIEIPVPADSDSPKFNATTGYAKLVPEKSAVVWTIGHFSANREYTLRVRLGLPSVKASEVEQAASQSQLGSPITSAIRPTANAMVAAVERKLDRPLEIRFEIPYYTMSGLQVRYLKIVERSGYPSLPWVRYVTQAGEYQVRLAQPTHQ